ncbi:hypothetical protein POM88_016364 [Heracleum sosnowskyi]|uniref:ethanolamine kinase n=1 Tax=Heracleum sosnowskyi TaxID=360622 RepID=A0AAD8MWU7_9APIA|nr:hypothetical protein POM88_016364 [Heracleum sosnowskyi]
MNGEIVAALCLGVVSPASSGIGGGAIMGKYLGEEGANCPVAGVVVICAPCDLLAIQYLSAAGFGAKLLGVFGNGMVQSFIHARTLGPLDMRKPDLAAKIAKQLHKFHQVEVPGSKEPQLWNDIFKFFKQGPYFSLSL